jgi:hypothetical protein
MARPIMNLKPMTDSVTLEKLKGGIKIYRYWTNFNASTPEVYSVIPNSDMVNGVTLRGSNWWSFSTNIEPSAFDYEWDPKRQRRFLFQMHDIYNRRKHRDNG